jgi:glycosyltransferase involved in cell wall biosynthesis
VEGADFALLPTSLKMLAAIARLRMRRSLFRMLVPVFDRLFPTTPMRVHDGFNILILNWRDPTHPQAGGAEAYLFEMARRWVSWGHRVSWLTASYRGATPESVLEGVEIKRVGNAATVYGAVAFEYVRRCRDRFDVILDAENGIPFFSPLFSMKPKIGIMHHVHQQVLRKHLRFPLSEVLAWAERRLMPRVYRNVQFVAVSQDTRQEMERLRLAARPVEVIHNGVAPDLAPGEKAGSPTLLCLGRLKPYKRVDLVVRAFARVRAVVPDAVLRVAGAGDEAVAVRLRALAEELGVTEAVVFEGYVDDERKRELLQRAWVCVSASEIEGWGVTAIEANACGTPVVAFDVPGLREAIVDAETGLLVPEGGDLSGAIVTVLTDASLRARLERGALARAQEFSWDRAADAMLDVIAREAVGKHYGLVRRRGDWVLHGAGAARVPVELRP